MQAESTLPDKELIEAAVKHRGEKAHEIYIYIYVYVSTICIYTWRLGWHTNPYAQPEKELQPDSRYTALKRA